MDMIYVIEEYQIQECILNFIAELEDEFQYKPISKEIVSIMQNKLDHFLSTLSDDFSYDYEVYITGRAVKFKFDMKRRNLYGFLG